LDQPYRIDVVILSWNRPEDTLDAIRSSEDQVGVETTIWVVDQGSEHESLRRLADGIRSFRSVNLVKLDRNYGVPGGRNRGIKLGTAEIVVCFDNDAVLDGETCLRDVINHFAAQPKLGALGFRIKNYHTGDLDRLSWVYPRTLLGRSSDSFLATRFCGAGNALRRAAFDAAGGYDERLFFYWEELDLSYRLINLGYEVAYEPRITVLHKISPQARTQWKTGRYYYLVRNALYVDWKYFRSKKRLLGMALGYLVKGFYNRLSVQAVKGIASGLAWCATGIELPEPLSATAREYVHVNDVSYRGSIRSRIWQEILERI
jgi:GT2 family glycosyltransferase